MVSRKTRAGIRAGDADHAGRARLPIYGGKLPEEFADVNIAEYHFTTAASANEGADDTADHEESVSTAFAMTEYLLLGLVSAPKTLAVEAIRLVIGQATKERGMLQCSQLSDHGSCFLQARSPLAGQTLLARR